MDAISGAAMLWWVVLPETGVILGTGADACEVAAVARGLQRGDRFLRGLFTGRERAGAAGLEDPASYYASLFAAKEALAKALGLGFGEQLRWTDLEVLFDDHGRLQARLTPRAEARLACLAAGRRTRLRLSATCDRAFALAVAVVESEPESGPGFLDP